MDAEVVVLGLGPGGEATAGDLAEAGLDVVGVEKELVGGECPYWACVPTKMMVRGSDLVTEARRVNGMAGAATVVPSWGPIARRIRDEATANWDDKVAIERLERKGVRVVKGEGRLDGPTSVVVGDDVINVSRAVVVATGTEPIVPPVAGLDTVDHWTNRDAVAATEVPDSLVVMGGGTVGCEFAQVFARFGARVTVLEGDRHLLAQEEPEACQLLQEVFGAEGIEVRTGRTAARVERASGDSVRVTLDDGNTVEGDKLLVATGRRANLEAIAAHTIGIDRDARWIPVDDHMRVIGSDCVWAIGDITGGGFTHMAMHHAGVAVASIVGRAAPPVPHHAVPRVTFTDPEVGAVGFTERAALEKGITVRTATAQVSASARGWIHKAGNEGFIKLVEDERRGVLVGATSVGPCGGEVLAMLTLAVHAAIPTDDLRHVVYGYPTFHRAIGDALKDLG